MAVAGNSLDAHYSCSKISVTGGNAAQICSAPASIPRISDCVVAGSLSLDAIMNGVKGGAFCYKSSGGVMLIS